MLLLELPDDVQLLLLVGRRQSQRLLPLVEHHLLDRLARLSVQVAELRVLRLDLRDVDGIVAVAHAAPPLHLVELLEVDDEAGAVLDGPEGIVDDDGLGEGGVDDVAAGRFARFGDVGLEPNFEMILGYDHVKISSAGGPMERNDDVDLLQGLGPNVFARDGASVAHRRWPAVLFCLVVVVVVILWGCYSGSIGSGGTGIFRCLGR